MDNENDKLLKSSKFPKDQKELKTFFIELLTDLECIKNLVYEGSDVPAHRSLQKTSDKIKEKIKRL